MRIIGEQISFIEICPALGDMQLVNQSLRSDEIAFAHDGGMGVLNIRDRDTSVLVTI
jgi:hypothetical protein